MRAKTIECETLISPDYFIVVNKITFSFFSYFVFQNSLPETSTRDFKLGLYKIKINSEDLFYFEVRFEYLYKHVKIKLMPFSN